jgi:hypothetical protein
VTEDEETLLLLFAGYVFLTMYDPVGRAVDKGVTALEKGGALLFDLSHGDAKHVKDLPRPDATNAARFAMLKKLATATGFPDPVLAAAIAMAESRGNATKLTVSKGGTGAPGYRGAERSVGLWQINMLAHPQYSEAWLKVPANNAKAALAVSHGGKDWRPWSAYTNGRYKEFVP